MENFLTRILPSMISNAPDFTRNVSSGEGDISISMPISIMGNVGDDTLPKIKEVTKQVIREINKTMQSRGILRDATSFSI